ncbi:hypothetical protein TYRP_003034 [Tyrophagus putrescentiae]|nr:hypothetical protein TYRP_003034 [Tyrophagus putrescentiae]
MVYGVTRQLEKKELSAPMKGFRRKGSARRGPRMQLKRKEEINLLVSVPSVEPIDRAGKISDTPRKSEPKMVLSCTSVGLKMEFRRRTYHTDEAVVEGDGVDDVIPPTGSVLLIIFILFILFLLFIFSVPLHNGHLI